MRVVTALVIMVVLTCPAAVRAESPFSLTVRLYNSAGLTLAGVQAARRAAEPILRETGVDVVFRQCHSASAPTDDPCDDRLKPGEVVVRIVDAPPLNPVLDPLAFGVTYVVRETNHGWLATVFADRVAEAASRVGMESGTLIGRVLAHEVGHLLLGAGYHGDVGLMRAQWPDGVLQHNTQTDWRFSMREAEAIQQRLLER